MKKAAPYIFLALVAVGLIALFFTGSNRKKKLDERITLRKKDKIPYGTYVAFQSLPALFPGASVYTSRREPGSWSSVSAEESGQLFIAITPMFNADEYEMEKLLAFAEKGNDVFISTRLVSGDAEKILECRVTDYRLPEFFADEKENLSGRGDSLRIVLKHPPYAESAVYRYPGQQYDAIFSRINERVTDELGNDEKGRTNFIHLRAGRGNFYLHLAPLAFSNYFLLHKKNMTYYEKALSVIDPGTKKIVWDEYYLTKKEGGVREKRKSWISVLFRYPGLKAALITALLTLLLFLLLEMRRKQRYIPVVAKPRNDSLDFVKTIGRLYYDKSDHRNLCRKMGSYFLEHVRSRYKLPTGLLDDEFIRNLQFKTGADEEELRKIVTFIKYAEDAPDVSAAGVTEFHKLLETFYKKA